MLLTIYHRKYFNAHSKSILCIFEFCMRDIIVNDVLFDLCTITFLFSSGSVLLKKQQQQTQPQTHHHHHHHQGPSNNLQHQQKQEPQSLAQPMHYYQASYQQRQYPSATSSHSHPNDLNNGSANFTSGYSSSQFTSASTKPVRKNNTSNGISTNHQFQNVTTQPPIQGKRVAPNRLENTVVSTTTTVAHQIDVGTIPSEAKILTSEELNASGMPI